MPLVAWAIRTPETMRRDTDAQSFSEVGGTWIPRHSHAYPHLGDVKQCPNSAFQLNRGKQARVANAAEVGQRRPWMLCQLRARRSGRPFE